jgi:hypothetical protein
MHRQLATTTCPGKNCAILIENGTLRRDVEAELGGGWAPARK